jgi:hypothetical protein
VKFFEILRGIIFWQGVHCTQFLFYIPNLSSFFPKYLWLQADFLQSEKEAILEKFPARNSSKEVANQNSKSHIFTLN